MSHKWMGHVTHMNVPCHTCKWVTSHIWLSHVARMNESRHAYEWVVSKCKLVMSRMCMSHVTHINASRYRKYPYRKYPSLNMCEFIMCDMTHWYVWHDSFKSTTWLVYVGDATRTESCHTWGSVTGLTWISHDRRTNYSPQTEEIGLKIITTAKIKYTTAKNSNKFSRESPFISNRFSR